MESRKQKTEYRSQNASLAILALALTLTLLRNRNPESTGVQELQEFRMGIRKPKYGS
jgi:hypothetical protein